MIKWKFTVHAKRQLILQLSYKKENENTQPWGEPEIHFNLSESMQNFHQCSR